MAFEWTEKENKRNIIYAEDINSMAREVIRLEEDKANKSNSLFGYGIKDAYTTKEADETFAKKSTTLKGYGIEDAYTKEESDVKFAFKETIYTKSEIDEKIKADITPTENSDNLITSGAVYDSLQKIPSGNNAQPPLFIEGWYIEKNLSSGKYSISNTHSYDAIREAYNSGRQVIIATQVTHVDEDGNPKHVGYVFLKYITDSIFQGISNINEFITVEYQGDATGWFLTVNELAEKKYVDTAIGDVETSLENIINKYGLGGETA